MQDHFQILGIKRSYGIDDVLQDAFVDKMKGKHPDSNLGSADITDAQNINIAYNTLKSKIDRCRHILELEGFGDKIKETGVSQDLLQDAMDWRESMWQIESDEEFHQLLKTIQGVKKNTYEALDKLMHNVQYIESIHVYIQLRFIERFYQEMVTFAKEKEIDYNF